MCDFHVKHQEKNIDSISCDFEHPPTGYCDLHRPLPTSHFLNMAGRPQSKAEKSWKEHEEADLLMACAVAAYQKEKLKGPGEKKKGLHTICKEVKIEHRKKTEHNICLNHDTLHNLVNSGRSMTDFNTIKSWLTKVEEKTVVEYAAELGEQGFLLTHWQLKEHVDKICYGRLGDQFLIGGVGHNWTQRSWKSMPMHSLCTIPVALTQSMVELQIRQQTRHE